VLGAASWVGAFPRVVSDEPFSTQALYNQYIHFKETEIPAREQEKGRIEELYKLLEVRSIGATQRLVSGSVVLLARLKCTQFRLILEWKSGNNPEGK